jgi:hypothetical protein
MAEIVGFLRKDATFGEKETLKYLSLNLPKEFTVYVETPLRKKRDLRYPDFIVLTNYGVIVLEVKDWVVVERADPSGATIRTRENEQRHEPNPVGKAREMAITLSYELNSGHCKSESGEVIPWSYVAVLINLPSSVITRLRRPWGEAFVFGKDDLANPNLLMSRLRNTFPPERMRPLTKNELEMIRATIFPVVEIERAGQPSFVLDQQQEKIVAEPVFVEEPSQSPKARKKDEAQRQEILFESLQSKEIGAELPERADRLSKNVAIRLVRGFSGSGKTLVLIQRAKYLAAQYPEWHIGVFTYNKPLQEQLERDFKGSSIEPRTFHGLCRSLLLKEGDAYNLDDWLEGNKFDFPIIRELGKASLKNEFEWLQDMALVEREAYMQVERHGVGELLRLTKEQRGKVFEAFEDYRTNLHNLDRWDWHELPLMAFQALNEEKISPNPFDAILIDEAQDWAPAWIRVVNQLLDPDHGLLFLADDPSQSIYRYFSWKEKGVDVVGRSRWLKVPYRNTLEIYRAAYSLISENQMIQSSLTDAGELMKPDLSSQEMRHGPKPLFRKFKGATEELNFIKDRIIALQQDGIHNNQVAVLTRFRDDIKPIQDAMKGLDVKINPIHSFKGLEMEAIFIPHVHKTFAKEEEDYEEGERRLMYMAMSRARSQLYMTYSGRLAKAYDILRTESLADFVA